jgi:hypothetical protein
MSMYKMISTLQKSMQSGVHAPENLERAYRIVQSVSMEMRKPGYDVSERRAFDVQALGHASEYLGIPFPKS